MDTEEYKALVADITRVPSPEKCTWAKKSKMCMLYIEFRNMDIIKHNLHNICNVYGGGDVALVIAYSGDNRDIILETTRDWKNVIHMELYDKNIEYQEYSRLLTSYDFWDKFSDFEYVLTNSWDSYIFKRVPEMFLQYDIVGSPCAHFFSEYNGHLVNICSSFCTCPRCKETNGNHFFKDINFIQNPVKYFMFNGGFYLRNVKSIKELCKQKPWSGETDDVYFAISNLSRPSRNEAKAFGVQDFMYDGIPVGCHQIWLKQPKEYVLRLFKGHESTQGNS